MCLRVGLGVWVWGVGGAKGIEPSSTLDLGAEGRGGVFGGAMMF